MFLTRLIDYTKLKAHLANGITLLNLSCGFISILFITGGHASIGVAFILFAALFDRFDGMVARKFDSESEFGKELDSLCDLVSFGIAPALLMYQHVLYQLPSVGMTLTVLFVICGAVRLARYNVKEFDGVFSGVPITAAGFIMALSFFLVPHVSVLFFVILEAVLTLLMVSNIKIIKM